MFSGVSIKQKVIKFTQMKLDEFNVVEWHNRTLPFSRIARTPTSKDNVPTLR